MIDWIEELLPAEEDDEGQEDVLALGRGLTAPAPPAPEAGTQDGGEETPPALAPEQGGGRAAVSMAEDGRPPDERPGGALEGPEDEGGLETAAGAARRALEQRLRAADEALGITQGGVGGTAPAVRDAGGPAGPGRAEENVGLEGLYRQAARSARPAPPTLGAEPAGQAVRPAEPEGGGSLTVDELDRAVRRDSRRYDGAMNIF